MAGMVLSILYGVGCAASLKVWEWQGCMVGQLQSDTDQTRQQQMECGAHR